MDQLDAMAAFVAVADQRSFAAAARRLHRSRPAMTRLVAALEAQLGVRLLQRTTRSVALTDAGARYLERARRILAEVEEAAGAAEADRSEPSGRFAVTAPQLFGRLHVAPALSALQARYPAVRGELLLLDRVVSLVEEGLDLAVRIGHLPDSSLVARSVGRVRRVVVASPAYLARRKAPRRPEQLTGHEVVQFTGLAPTREWRFLEGEAERRVALEPRLVTNSADAAIAEVEAGRGLTLVLSYMVAEAVRAGRLRVVLPGYEPAPLPVQLVYPSGRLLSAKVRAFAEVVAEEEWDFTRL